MSRSPFHQRMNTPPSPGQLRSGKTRGSQSKASSHSESGTKSGSGIQNTSSGYRKSGWNSESSSPEEPDPRNEPIGSYRGTTPKSTKSTPVLNNTVNTYTNMQADLESSPHSDKFSHVSCTQSTKSPMSKQGKSVYSDPERHNSDDDLYDDTEHSPPLHRDCKLYPVLDSTASSRPSGKPLPNSPKSSTKSSQGPLTSKQANYGDLRKRLSDDDMYDDESNYSPTFQNQLYRRDFQHEQGPKKRNKDPPASYDATDKRLGKEVLLESTSQNYHKHFDNENGTGLSMYIIAVLIITTMLLLFCLNLPSSGSKEESPSLSRYELFSIDIKGLQHQFPSQKDRLWRSVIASSRHVLKEPNSTYPSIILLASQVESPRLSFCIAEKIASSFVKSHGINPGQVPTTDIETIKGFEADQQKLMLDRDIQAALEKPSEKAYIIQNLQTLSPQAALLLHGLCDGDNAPYKDVMILMTLELKETMPAKTAHEIETYLTQLWTTPQVEYDKVAAVMSRISNNLVIIQHESPASVEKLCPI